MARTVSYGGTKKRSSCRGSNRSSVGCQEQEDNDGCRSGIAGMIIIGSQVEKSIQNEQFAIGQGKFFQLQEHVFMFVLIGGLGLVIYSQVSAQREKAKQRARVNRDNKSADAA